MYKHLCKIWWKIVAYNDRIISITILSSCQRIDVHEHMCERSLPFDEVDSIQLFMFNEIERKTKFSFCLSHLEKGCQPLQLTLHKYPKDLENFINTLTSTNVKPRFLFWANNIKNVVTGNPFSTRRWILWLRNVICRSLPSRVFKVNLCFIAVFHESQV